MNDVDKSRGVCLMPKKKVTKISFRILEFLTFRIVVDVSCLSLCLQVLRLPQKEKN